ncbi:MAG: hypothetical protein CVU47_01360 [Chloroflexi bacterium HGW-Chloroflexi-9]|nr:MAG: hypothetical protein CVU47_01360 [Chloroflexi bacterium HGW-Chloroflexi-9]
MIAIATYAHPSGETFEVREAAESGYEGVACVDDAARAAIVYAGIWRRHGSAWARETAEGLLAFTRAMQVEGGAFVNFIATWNGERQLDTTTSYPGGDPWQARAMHALAYGVGVFDRPAYVDAFEAGLPALSAPTPHLDVRALRAIAVFEYWQATADSSAGALALAWAEELAGTAVEGILPDRAGSDEVHLWGHLQEAALARIGRAFGRNDLIQVAAQSADELLVPVVLRAFGGARSLAFDVSSVIAGLEAVAAATSDHRYIEHAAAARAWFDGRNAAGRSVYDRTRGLVADGIDGDRVSVNSGAESNIEGALAFLDVLPWDSPPLTSSRWPRIETRMARMPTSGDAAVTALA